MEIKMKNLFYQDVKIIATTLVVMSHFDNFLHYIHGKAALSNCGRDKKDGISINVKV